MCDSNGKMKNTVRTQILLTFMLFIGTGSSSGNLTFQITSDLLNCTSNGIEPIPKINVKTIEIRNGNISSITSDTFKQYKNLEKLTVANSNVAQIDDEAFKHLPRLNEIDLRNNVLQSFTFDDLRNITNLKKLILSGNMLTNLNGYPSDKLSELDVSNNKLTYLPESFRKRRSLQLIVENNPWECVNLSSYGHYLSEFCKGSGTRWMREQDQKPIALKQTDEALDCNFEDCLYYIIGAAWVGIILGNLCMIRKFVCPELHETIDVGVQYDKMEVPS